MAATKPITDGRGGGAVAAVDAIILAGGFGTRLARRVPGRPKPLAPVGGRPFLALQLDWLAMQPVRLSHTRNRLATCARAPPEKP